MTLVDRALEYGWFPKDLAADDLKEAKALLDELSWH